MFVHVVLFTLNDSAPESARQGLIDACHKFLGNIPGVRHLWAGRNALTPRDVVDKNYHVGLTVLLDDVAAHDLYQSHPLHLEFIAQQKAHWKQVRVFDFK